MARAGRGERAGSSAAGKGVDTVTARSVPNMYEDMPASSDDLQVPIEELDALLAVYGSLRSFSFLFRLSPAPLHLLCSELNQTRMSSLIDEVCRPAHAANYLCHRPGTPSPATPQRQCVPRRAALDVFRVVLRLQCRS